MDCGLGVLLTDGVISINTRLELARVARPVRRAG